MIVRKIGGLHVSCWISRANTFTGIGSKSTDSCLIARLTTIWGDPDYWIEIVEIEAQSTGLREPGLMLVTVRRPVSAIVVRLCNLVQSDRIVSGL